MDSINKPDKLRETVISVLEGLANPPPSYGQVEIQCVFDTVRDHYQLVSVGWEGESRAFGTFVHVDIRDGKIWIQHDGTDFDVAARLLEHGIDRQQIVLGFQSPGRRPFTDYATG